MSMLQSSTVDFGRKVIHLAGLAPLFFLLLGWLTGRVDLSRPGPIFGLCGIMALSFLLLTLTVTPAAKILKTPSLIKLRRPCGLWSFTWAAAHAGIFLIVFMRLDLARVIQAVQNRPFIFLGQLAFLILLTLALTSSKRAMGVLGRNWRRLHRLIYLAIILVCTHFWLAESESSAPKAAAVFAAFLLLFRAREALRKS